MGVQGDAEWREQWLLVNTPLGEEWSGRTRYAAAMFFYRKGAMSAEALEVYRLCSRLDHEDPLAIVRQRGVGKGWLDRFADQGDASVRSPERRPIPDGGGTGRRRTDKAE